MKQLGICPLPFNQLYLHSSGEVYPCGFLQGRHSLGNINKMSFSQIWNSYTATEFRDSHKLKNNKHCGKCQKLYNCHLLHDNMWQRSGENDQYKLKRLDIMIDSFCNLKCIMCTNRSEVNDSFSDENFWVDFEHNLLPELEEIELVGGEPLIIKETYRLFDLVLKVNPKVRIVLTTNGHLELSDKIKSYITKLNFYAISVSIDSLSPKKFEKIRVNGKLEKSLKFLFQLKELKETSQLKFYLNCNFLIQKQNWEELQDFLEFELKHGIKVYPILLREPTKFSILDFNPTELLNVFDEYINLSKNNSNLYLKNILSKISKSIPKRHLLSRIALLEEIVNHDRKV
ncbi:MAG: SPASM domain-containing protein [Bacteriovoracaceae bacterium]|jgi:radical SAM protein with 4Fe4S-binding SPASM domain|nr:hypothetical protein [Halobacteriovoraceae bacterium]MDP7321880.1 SPASM domain-containing protein [Bacteriovoracaceae bacterium]